MPTSTNSDHQHQPDNAILRLSKEARKYVPAILREPQDGTE